MKCYLNKDIDKALMNDTEILSWVDLYTKLGISDYLLKAGMFDVKHIYCNPKIAKEIDEHLRKNIQISKSKRVRPYKPFYRDRMHSLDSVCYSPTYCSFKYKRGIYVVKKANIKISQEELNEWLEKETKNANGSKKSV